MDIVLPTRDDNYLGFREVQPYSDRSGFGAYLVVRAHGFEGALLFRVESEPFVSFIESIENMDRSLTGKARLKPIFEDPYIDLALEQTGKVRVSGELIAYGPPTQRLQFEFMTDQTVLGPSRANYGHASPCEPPNDRCSCQGAADCAGCRRRSYWNPLQLNWGVRPTTQINDHHSV